MIGVLTTSYPLSGSGDARGGFVEGFSRWLAGVYGDVEVLCAAPRTPFGDGGAPATLRGGGLAAWLGAARFSSRLFGEALRRRRRWSALVAHWLVPCGAIAAAVAGGRPCLAIAHGSDARWLVAHAAGRAIARVVAARAELVYVDDKLRIDGAHGRVAPMGVDRAALVDGDRDATRRGLAIAEPALVVLFLGRLVDEKGCDVLLAALTPPLDGVVAVVAGDGPARQRLQAVAPSSVRFLGPLDAAGRRAWLAAADVLVQPSRTDGAPLAVAEAQVVGLPVIASTAGASHVADGVDGLVVPVGSTADLRRSILRLRDDTALRRQLADASRVRGRQHDWTIAGPKIVAQSFAGLAPTQAHGHGNVSVWCL